MQPVAQPARSAAAELPAAAAVLAKARRENFRVAGRLLPARVRDDLLAIYGFARLVDDVGDEARGDRRALLDCLEAELDAVYEGEPQLELMRRLVPTVRAHAIPREPLARLIEANRRDQEVTRYRTFADLRDYCRLSADPVGHLVLHVFDAATPERLALSDSVCTGLQVVEHVQDVAEDLERGRVYLPLADMERFGCAVDDLARRPAPAAVRELIGYELVRARRLLGDGLPLARQLPWRPGLAVAAFAAGGLAAATAIERAGCDVSGGPPRASRARRALRLGAMLARLP